MNPLLLNVPESFETERLLLRSPQHGDGPMVNQAIQESFSDLSKWLNWADHVPEIEETEANARRAQSRFLLREDFTFSIIDKFSGDFIGACSLVRINWDFKKFEIGYWIRSSKSGFGYMTEAVNGVTDFAQQHFDVNRIVITCDTENTSSRQVAERCGFRLEAILRQNYIAPSGQPSDDCIYTKIRLPDGQLGYPVD